jgi:Mrp family chromosome partitioning ATPase
VTEQSKIPLPPEGTGKSLFERAEGLFGFEPAPVPAGLAGAPDKRGRKAEPAVEAKVPEPAEVQVAGSLPGSAPPAFAPAPQPRAEERPVEFRGPIQPVDRNHLKRQGLIQPDGKVTALLEEFRIVKRQLLLAVRDARAKGAGDRAQRVLVCSPLPGEGKTFCATNLALALAAEKDSEVVLVDADFAKPSILSTLGLPGGPGLMDALADPSILVEDCVISTDIPGFHVLPAGNPTTSDSEYLASSRTAAVLDRLTCGAPGRIVIFDSPPALAATPAAELSKHVGQALVVVRADTTGQASLEDALSLLSDCPDIKLLLNAALYSPSGRRFGSYYGYGE